MNNLNLITCIVQRGRAEKVVDAALKAGAPGATYYYGRGTGVRQKLGVLSKLIVPEKEIILILLTTISLLFILELLRIYLGYNIPERSS